MFDTDSDDVGQDSRNTAVDSTDPWWRTTWPVGRVHWLHIVRALAAVIAGGAALGLVMFRWLAPNVLTDLDQDIAEWFVDQRTPARNDVATWAAGVADTGVKIAATVVVVAVMLRLWRRWHEAFFVGLTLVFEATAFIVITFLVKRPRPAVVRLLESPVDSSFPSGHVAAATVYGALVVIVFWHTRRVPARVFAVLIGALLPIIVGIGRMYQGMHFLSDVVGGTMLGVITLVICARIVGPPNPSPEIGPI